MTDPSKPQLDTASLLAAGVSPTRAGGSSRWQPPSPEQLVGAFPNLQMLELLGVGGMGAVYKARQIHLDRMVAVKLLAPRHAADPGFDERFAREARALARLEHPNIVAVHDFGRVLDRSYLVMQHIDGSNLRQVIATGTLSGAEVLRLVRQICDALEHAHAAGVVHRDLKPENILIDGRGNAHIADFGLAKLNEGGQELTGTGEVLGTLHYMAPEQLASAAAVDHRADLYALGVIIYEMLTGSLPLGRFAPPSDSIGVAASMDAVVLKSLEPDPVRRFGSAGEMRSALEGAASAPGVAKAEAAGDAVARARQREREALGRAQTVRSQAEAAEPEQEQAEEAREAAEEAAEEAREAAEEAAEKAGEAAEDVAEQAREQAEEIAEAVEEQLKAQGGLSHALDTATRARLEAQAAAARSRAEAARARAEAQAEAAKRRGAAASERAEAARQRAEALAAAMRERAQASRGQARTAGQSAPDQPAPAPRTVDAKVEPVKKPSKVRVGLDGIHVVDGDDEVRVGWDGVHVKDGKEQVSVGWTGVHVTPGDRPGMVPAARNLGGDHKFFRTGMLMILAGSALGIFLGAEHLRDFWAGPSQHFSAHRDVDLAMFASSVIASGGVALLSRCCLPVVILSAIALILPIPWLWHEHGFLVLIYAAYTLWLLAELSKFGRIRDHMSSLPWHDRLLRLLWVAPLIGVLLVLPVLPWMPIWGGGFAL